MGFVATTLTITDPIGALQKRVGLHSHARPITYTIPDSTSHSDVGKIRVQAQNLQGPRYAAPFDCHDYQQKRLHRWSDYNPHHCHRCPSIPSQMQHSPCRPIEEQLYYCRHCYPEVIGKYLHYLRHLHFSHIDAYFGSLLVEIYY